MSKVSLRDEFARPGIKRDKAMFGPATREVRCGVCALESKRTGRRYGAKGVPRSEFVGSMLADDDGVSPSFTRYVRVRANGASPGGRRVTGLQPTVRCRKGHLLDCSSEALKRAWHVWRTLPARDRPKYLLLQAAT